MQDYQKQMFCLACVRSGHIMSKCPDKLFFLEVLKDSEGVEDVRARIWFKKLVNAYAIHGKGSVEAMRAE